MFIKKGTFFKSLSKIIMNFAYEVLVINYYPVITSLCFYRHIFDNCF